MKKLIVTILAVVVGVSLLFFINKNKLHSTEEIEEEVSKYSFNYSFIRSENGTVGVEGYMETEKDLYFHDNEFDFDFYAKSLISSISKEKQLYVGYWGAYMDKASEILGNEFEQCIKESFDEIYDISKIEFEYSADRYDWSIVIEGNKKENYSKEKWELLGKKALREICNILEEYDPNFKKRKLKEDTWFDSDEELYFRLDGDYNPTIFFSLSDNDIF